MLCRTAHKAMVREAVRGLVDKRQDSETPYQSGDDRNWKNRAIFRRALCTCLKSDKFKCWVKAQFDIRDLIDAGHTANHSDSGSTKRKRFLLSSHEAARSIFKCIGQDRCGRYAHVELRSVGGKSVQHRAIGLLTAQRTIPFWGAIQ
jgi:Zn ribbon nucleic-acid-binding protein